MEDKKEVNKKERYYAFGKRITKKRMENICFNSSVLNGRCCKKHCGSNLC